MSALSGSRCKPDRTQELTHVAANGWSCNFFPAFALSDSGTRSATLTLSLDPPAHTPLSVSVSAVPEAGQVRQGWTFAIARESGPDPAGQRPAGD
jgi:hypothetical protein